MQAYLEGYSATIFVGWQDRKGVADHQAFRKQLFIDKLKWPLTHENGLEFDEFDTSRAVYCVLYHDTAPVGGWRALRTTEDYLSSKVFPALAPENDYPSRPDIWEISRLGVIPHRTGAVSARLIYGLMVQFAMSRDATSLIGVIDVTHARRMGMAGLSIHALGDAQDVGLNTLGLPITAFLAELRPEEQCGAPFEKMMNLLESLEISDEASFHRSERIPA